MSSPSLELLRRESAEPGRFDPGIQDSLAPPTLPVPPDVLAPISSAELLAMQQATDVLSAPQPTNQQAEGLSPSGEILGVSAEVVARVGAQLGGLRVQAGFRTPPTTPTGRTQALREAGPNN